MDRSDQDASEFLFQFLDKLDLELKIHYKSPSPSERRRPEVYFDVVRDYLHYDWLDLMTEYGYSMVKDLFYNTHITKNKCVQCGFK